MKALTLFPRYSMLLPLLIGCLLGTPGASFGAARGEKATAIVVAKNATWMETFAAREVRRYWYLRTGRLLPIRTETTMPKQAGLLLVGSKSRGLVANMEKIQEVPAATSLKAFSSSIFSLGPEEYLLKTVQLRGGESLLVLGGDEAGTLYGAYQFAEQLGVRFYLHGDVIPDVQENLRLPVLNEHGKPLFALRGIQPFHDFPEGPDWWNLDDYQAILSQLPKLRMNFFGLHTYPEKRPDAEPTVWIGLAEDVSPKGEVKFSYCSSYQNTLRGNWGYQAKKTSDFYRGGSELFESDGFGPDVMLGFCGHPATPTAYNAVFNSTGEMLQKAFRHAHQLGIKTCAGTETPLVVPKLVAEKLKAAGKNLKDPASIQEVYEGIFRRAAAAYDLDYYWFWTPEDWTWKDVKPEQLAETTNDLAAAIAAANKVKPPFKLATCGWVLGPQTDRALFDKVLPKEMAVSCINREVGRTPVDPAFAKVEGRGKWAIPWLEDDPGLTAPQLWAGRMRRDALDAHRYGCDGLMGIHWRTRVLAPAVLALARAAWEQGEWAKYKPVEPPRVPGPVGGQVAAFSNPIADTEEDAVYQTVRYNVSAYHLPWTNGACTVTLQFCEPHYTNIGQRAFDVKLQGQTVIENLDIFGRVGKNRALDYTYNNVAATNGWVDIEFVPRVEYPSIAGICISNSLGVQKINCAGPAYKDYAADPPGVPSPKESFPPTLDFYEDWAMHEFGPEAGKQAAAVFAKIDGALPRPADWVEGPGGIRPDKRSWDKVAPEYGFVGRLAMIAGVVKGPGNRERFEYWVRTFQYMRSMAQANCVWAQYDEVMKKVKAEKKPDVQKELARKEALPLRIKIVRLVSQVYDHLLATVSNPGELGTLANWEQHLLPDLLEKPGKELAKILGGELTPEAQLSSVYGGPVRVIVPAKRTSYTQGEDFKLKVIVLSDKSPEEATLYWRSLGRGAYAKVSASHLGRGVYTFQLPPGATAGEDLEYYVKVVPEKGKAIYWPFTAPKINQTLVAQ